MSLFPLSCRGHFAALALQSLSFGRSIRLTRSIMSLFVMAALGAIRFRQVRLVPAFLVCVARFTIEARAPDQFSMMPNTTLEPTATAS